jgi:RNA polymerase sigma factor (sigma-70 family)
MPEPLLTRDEEVVLAARILSGDQSAIDELVRRSTRLQNWMVAQSDLAPWLTGQERSQACARGAVEAARRFDPAKGRFSTYCVIWIRKCLREDQKAAKSPYTWNMEMSLVRDGGAADLERERVDASVEADSILSVLSDRERAVMEMLHGIGDGVVRTIEEAGRELGISRTRAYHLKKRAMRKMRRKKI